jgi:hypothetical protein
VAKPVILTVDDEPEVLNAIASTNAIDLDHYLLKPCDPPEERLYPVLDDLLDDWRANHPPMYQGIRVAGTRWSPATHAVRDFLARSQIPYQSELRARRGAVIAQVVALPRGGVALGHGLRSVETPHVGVAVEEQDPTDQGVGVLHLVEGQVVGELAQPRQPPLSTIPRAGSRCS